MTSTAMITQQLNGWQGMDFESTLIVLIFDAGGNCVGDTALMNPSQ